MNRAIRIFVLPALAATVAACATFPAAGPTRLAPEQEAFWATIRSHCGRAYEGRLTFSSAVDSIMANRRLVMHVRECDGDVIRIPFHVGEDRSRTWVLTRTSSGITLKHDHRHEDGTPDDITWYGGDTRDAGEPGKQTFPADAHTISLNPVYGTNVWTMEIDPSRFAYQLIRVGTDRRIRVEFDLTRAVPAPPAPWGS